MKNSFEKNEQ